MFFRLGMRKNARRAFPGDKRRKLPVKRGSQRRVAPQELLLISLLKNRKYYFSYIGVNYVGTYFIVKKRISFAILRCYDANNIIVIETRNHAYTIYVLTIYFNFIYY